MAMAVVDMLEVVDVDQQQRAVEALARPHRARAWSASPTGNGAGWPGWSAGRARSVRAAGPGSTPAAAACCARAGTARPPPLPTAAAPARPCPDALHQLAVGQSRRLELVVARQQLDVALLALVVVALAQLLQRGVAVLAQHLGAERALAVEQRQRAARVAGGGQRFVVLAQHLGAAMRPGRQPTPALPRGPGPAGLQRCASGRSSPGRRCWSGPVRCAGHGGGARSAGRVRPRAMRLQAGRSLA